LSQVNSNLTKSISQESTYTGTHRKFQENSLTLTRLIVGKFEKRIEVKNFQIENFSHILQRLTLDKGATGQTQKPQKDSDLKRERIVRRAALEFKVTNLSTCQVLEEIGRFHFSL
jgi:hypothetical protein